MPNAAFAGKDTFVSIRGPPGAFNHQRLEGLLERYKRGQLRVLPNNILRWLSALRMLSAEVFGSVEILPADVAAREAATLADNLLATVEQLPTTRRVATEGAIACSDVTRPQNDAEIPAEDDDDGAAEPGDLPADDEIDLAQLTVTMVGNRYQQGTVETATRRVLEAVQAAVPRVTATAAAPGATQF